ncbi:MAG: PaaI family thioesterase [Acidimicrobiales bacterium]
MALRRLHNDDWGFETNCFVCEARNEAGLRIPFAHDDDAGLVVAEFELDNRYSSAPDVVHGGVMLAVLDEAQAWAAIAIAGKFAFTTATSARFHRAARVGRRHRVEARVLAQADTEIATAAVVYDDRERLCAESEATFLVLSAATARHVAGLAEPELFASYLRR